MIAVSHDGGQTWQLQLQPQPGSGVPVTVIQDVQIDDRDWALPPGSASSTRPTSTIGPEGDIYVSNFGGGDFAVFHSDRRRRELRGSRPRHEASGSRSARDI